MKASLSKNVRMRDIFIRKIWINIKESLRRQNKNYLNYKKITNGFVYSKIVQGMYGLPQAGILAKKSLKEYLSKHGYYKLNYIPGLFKHKTRPV